MDTIVSIDVIVAIDSMVKNKIFCLISYFLSLIFFDSIVSIDAMDAMVQFRIFCLISFVTIVSIDAIVHFGSAQCESIDSIVASVPKFVILKNATLEHLFRIFSL